MRKRDGFVDALRALALVRVVAYHTLALWWLHVAFPAVGVMFGLAGSLMAASLSRPSARQRSSLAVVGSRLRRLLLPLWLYALVAVLSGWEAVGRHGLDWTRLPFWLLPLRDPHESPAGSGFVDTLWYLRTYVWFILLSPWALRMFRRSPAIAISAPLLVLPVVAFAPGGQWLGRGELTAFIGYGICWLLGFAHHDGLLRQLPVRLCWQVAIPTAVAGLALLVGFSLAGGTNSSVYDVGDALWSAAVVLLLLRWSPDLGWLPIDALWSAAVVLLLLRWSPDLGWLPRIGWLDRAVTVVNARAVTIYLWHDAVIVAVRTLLGLAGLGLPGLRLVVVLALTTVVMFAVGWVEDLAAGRRPTLLPGSTSRHGQLEPSTHDSTA